MSNGSANGSWPEHPTSRGEAELAAGLEQARARLPDEVTLRRLWGKIANPELERPARARWPWFVGGVVSSAALAVTLAVWLWPGGSPARRGMHPTASAATMAAGTGAPRSPAGSNVAQSPLAGRLAAGGAGSLVGSSKVRTGAGEKLSLTLRGGAEAHLEPTSILRVDSEAGGGDRPVVEQGAVSFSVPHQAPGHSFSVAAGPYRIVVVGTKFRLRVEGEHVAVHVDEGVVEVWRKRRLARLTPGDSWSSPSEPTGPAEAARSSSNGDARPAGSGPKSPPAEAPPAAAATSRDPAQEARSALAAGEPYRALDVYRAIAARGGPAAENAEYEIGRVLRDRLRQPDEAITAWRRYRSQHPDGLLRIETDVSIIETLVRSGDSGGALAEANDFLRRHPDSERRGEIARVAGDLYRAQGDCHRAIGAYHLALSSSRAKDVTEYASFHSAACLANLGDAAGNAALRDYLRAWPSGRFSGDANRLLQAMNDRTKTP